MRILVVNKYWAPVGGVEKHLADVCTLFQELGHEVIPFTMRQGDEWTPDGPASPYYPSPAELRARNPVTVGKGVLRSTWGVGSVGQLRRFVKSHSIDCAYVLHVYHQLSTKLLTELNDAGIPTILSLHDYKIGCPNYRYFSEKTSTRCTRCLGDARRFLPGPILERCWNGSALAGAILSLDTAYARLRGDYSGVTVLSVLNSVQELSARAAGVEDRKIVRTFHPVEVTGPPIDSDRDGTVLYVGRLAPEKGVDDLIAACAEVGCQLIIAGDGRERAALEEMARGLDATVTFLGHVSGDIARDLMERSSLMVIPSVWDEVWPFTVLEGIAAGIPLVATAVGGMTEQLADGRGLLVPARQVPRMSAAIRFALTDPVAAQHRAEAARRYASQAWSYRLWKQNIQGQLDRAMRDRKAES